MSLHFAKVSIVCRTTTFGKVDYSDNQLLFWYIVGAICKSPSKNESIWSFVIGRIIWQFEINGISKGHSGWDTFHFTRDKTG